MYPSVYHRRVRVLSLCSVYTMTVKGRLPDFLLDLIGPYRTGSPTHPGTASVCSGRPSGDPHLQGADPPCHLLLPSAPESAWLLRFSFLPVPDVTHSLECVFLRGLLLFLGPGVMSDIGSPAAPQLLAPCVAEPWPTAFSPSLGASPRRADMAGACFCRALLLATGCCGRPSSPSPQFT